MEATLQTSDDEHCVRMRCNVKISKWVGVNIIAPIRTTHAHTQLEFLTECLLRDTVNVRARAEGEREEVKRYHVKNGEKTISRSTMAWILVALREYHQLIHFHPLPHRMEGNTRSQSLLLCCWSCVSFKSRVCLCWQYCYCGECQMPTPTPLRIFWSMYCPLDYYVFSCLFPSCHSIHKQPISLDLPSLHAIPNTFLSPSLRSIARTMVVFTHAQPACRPLFFFLPGNRAQDIAILFTLEESRRAYICC